MNYQINQTIMIRKEMVVYKGRGLTDVKQLKVFFCLFVFITMNWQALEKEEIKYIS